MTAPSSVGRESNTRLSGWRQTGQRTAVPPCAKISPRYCEVIHRLTQYIVFCGRANILPLEGTFLPAGIDFWQHFAGGKRAGFPRACYPGKKCNNPSHQKRRPRRSQGTAGAAARQPIAVECLSKGSYGTRAARPAHSMKMGMVPMRTVPARAMNTVTMTGLPGRRGG